MRRVRGCFGAHVRDEADRPAVLAFALAQVDALVEPLGNLHGALGAEAEAVDGVLLELAGCVRRRGIAFALALGDLGDAVARVLEVGADDGGLIAGLDRQLLAAA
jgi:hypothetical protein